MKPIKQFFIAMIATIALTASSCSKSEDSDNNEIENKTPVINKISGTTWEANVQRVWITNHGKYTFNFEKNSNVCSLRFIPDVKIYEGVKNEEKMATGTYILDEGWGDRGYYMLTDNDSNPFTNDMIFKRGQKTRFYVNNENFITNGVPNNYLEVKDGQLDGSGASYLTIFFPIKN